MRYREPFTYTRADVAARDLEPDERATYSNGARKALYRDPDGNEVGFAGAPLD